MKKEAWKRTLHYLALFMAVGAISCSAILIRFSRAPAVVIAFYRMLFSFMLVLPGLLWHFPGEARKLAGREILLASASGSFLALHFLTWITSLQLTSVASSVILVTMQPVFTLLGGHFFLGERVRLRELLGVVVALTGAFILAGSDAALGSRVLSGNALAFLSSLFYAGYLLLGRFLRRSLSLWLYTAMVYGICSLVLAGAAGLLQTPFYPYPAREYLLFLAMAFIATMGGHTVFIWLLRYLPVGIVSMSILGEPIGATLLAFLLLGEVPTAGQLVGGTLVLGGLFWFLAVHPTRD